MPLRRNRLMIWIFGTLGVVTVAAAAGVADYRYEQHDVRKRAEAITGGNIDRGERAFTAYGCGGCHSVLGVTQAQGQVGPPLDGVGGRAMIAGKLENKPGNLIRWIMDPQRLSPGTAMPDLAVTERDARDISAFLYTQS
jgi:cytochrome c